MRTGEPTRPAPSRAFSGWFVSRPTLWIIAPMIAVICLLPLTLIGLTRGVSWGPYVLFLAPVLMLAQLAESMTRVTVGADGVLIFRRFRRRFIPFTTMASASEVDGICVRLVLRDGSPVDLFTYREEQVGKPAYEKRCEELLGRIREAIDRCYACEAGAAEHAGAVARLEAASALAAPTAGAYRAAAPIARDELWGVIEDVSAPSEARAAAAASLRGQASREERERLLRTADVTAEPRLSHLLRIASEPEVDQAALAEAMEAVEPSRPGALGGR